MYEYLNGVITMIDPTFIVVEVSGVGYHVQVANPYAFTLDKTTRVYIEQVVRENEMALYGFADSNEKMLFLKLLAVSGIGPKSALAILARNDHLSLVQAIQDNDVTYLTKFPGIGKKTAQQIVLDLQGKLGELPFINEIDVDLVVPIKTVADNQALADAIEALGALGYTAKQLQKVEKELGQASLVDSAAYISAGLKLLN